MYKRQAIVGISDAFDKYIVDGVFNGLGIASKKLGRALTMLQTGQVQLYTIVAVAGTIILLAIYLAYGSWN